MTGIIILAAGASTRLGRAKQTLLYRNKTLLNHSISEAVKANLGPVLVIIGANKAEVLSQTQNEGISMIINQNWKNGMSSSIRKGIVALLEKCPEVENAILMVCDQPYVDEHVLISLVNTKKASKKPIVACFYNNTMGVPALFDKQLFNELMSLTGEAGGKSILAKHHADVALVHFNLGTIDIDTIADYERLED